ncbi:MAG: chemotaxis protein CheA [Gammaproteobacteria bacterium]|nr:chemotaxis protein CheA [Gammaproteobacteria bacterium]MCP5195354.1 chemotaxis protein CheA [Gammaproteobacteria bacterium]
MTPLLAQFIAESREQLEMTSAGLLAIESNPNDLDKLNEIFRAVHTIKGSSGLFEIRPVTVLVHAAEDLLDALRSQEVEFDRSMIDLLLDAFDQVNQWLEELERHETLPEGLESRARELGGQLRAFLNHRQVETVNEETLTAPTFTELDWLGQFPEHERAALYSQRVADEGPLTVFRYIPDAQCFFSGEDPFYQVRQIPGLSLLAIVPTEPWPSLAEMDAYHCILRFEGIASAAHGELAELFRYVPEQTALLNISPEALAVPVGRPDETVHAEFVNEGLTLANQEDWAGLRGAVEGLRDNYEPETWMASALRWLQRLLDSATPDLTAVCRLLEAMRTGQSPDWLAALAQPLAQTADAAPASAPASRALALTAEEESAFQRIVAEQARSLTLPTVPESWSGRILSIFTCLSNVLRYVQRADLLEELEETRETVLDTHDIEPLKNLLGHLVDAEDAAADSAQELSDSPGAATEVFKAITPTETTTGSEKQIAKILKIDQHKVDRLMDLIGELVVAKNALPYLAQRAEKIYGVRDMAREIKEQYAVINRIAQDLQGSIMQVRMMPVGQVFQRFPRLVRDLSKKLDKKIQLIIKGEDTEADKNIIETLADPLIHILRNSIDHGIEPPEERLLAGKAEEGAIRVNAYQDNDSVAIEINDDGRGVDATAVKNKAVRRGLLTEEQAEAMTDHEAVQLIFAPGLSTAEQVSDISGRGVGMDVVRNSIDRVGGAVTVNSRRGAGTDIRLTLPLSMAVTHVMAVELDGKLLGIPMDLVVETVRLPPAALFSIKHRETFVLRDQVVPLARLRRLLSMDEPATGEAALATLVVKVQGENIGLVVDNFREGMEVILKPMEGVLGSLRQYAGTALLGDGSVMLVINIKELL